MNKKGKRVAVAMSGGVDSSVAALLLKEAGLEVIGVTMQLWSCHKEVKNQRCCSVKDQMDARRVCEVIGIPFYLMDLRDEFRRHVVDYFAHEYSIGRTPNPCIKCNEIIKFNTFAREAKRLFDADYIATGHHVRRQANSASGKGAFKLLKGRDRKKDQSYFLFSLKQDQIERALFPVGDFEKDEIRKIACKRGLPTMDKKESQEICFVPDGDYPQFIVERYPQYVAEGGNFIDKEGNILGRHIGAHAYTIGQRRGLGIGFGKRKYVVELNTKDNSVVLGENDDLYKTQLIADGVNWIDPYNKEVYQREGAFVPVRVKIRYNDRGVDAVVTSLGGDAVRVNFSEPRRAVTRGQAVVFYNGDEVLGGGWIV